MCAWMCPGGSVRVFGWGVVVAVCERNEIKNNSANISFGILSALGPSNETNISDENDNR